MKKKDDRFGQAAQLRRQAEEEARSMELQDIDVLSPEENLEMLYELRVHQIELEMQNQDLCQAQLELDAARAHYFDLYDLAPVGYCTLSKEGLILEANLTAATLLGVIRGELVNRPITRFILKEDEDTYYLHRNHLFATTAPQTFELRLRREDPTPFWVRMEAVAAQDADGASVCRVVLSDITERKLAEKSLAESEEKFRAIANYTTDWENWHGPDGRLLWVNPAVEQMTGYTVSECFAMSTFPLPLIAEEDRAEMSGVIQNAVRGGRGNDRKLHMVRKDRTRWWGSVSWQPVFASNGTAMGYRSGVRDITEREQAEESLRKANELQRVESGVLATQEILLVEQRRGKRRLQKLNRELGRRNRELQDFVQVASHDLRAPLVNIRGFGDLLASACDRARTAVAGSQDEASLRAELLPLLGEDIPESLGFIRVGSSKMDSLLTGLLNISRIGIAALNLQELDMNQMVAEIVKSLAFSIEQSGASVQIDALPPCRGDAIQLGQVFSNLLDNALKHLDPSRPGVIRVSGVIRVFARPRRKETVYCVEDNGIGIEAKHQEAVFGLFHRINPDRGGGQGLGLAIVRRALDRQDGKVWLESTPNQGSKFFVSLPRL